MYWQEASSCFAALTDCLNCLLLVVNMYVMLCAVCRNPEEVLHQRRERAPLPAGDHGLHINGMFSSWWWSVVMVVVGMRKRIVTRTVVVIMMKYAEERRKKNAKRCQSTWSDPTSFTQSFIEHSYRRLYIVRWNQKGAGYFVSEQQLTIRMLLVCDSLCCRFWRQVTLLLGFGAGQCAGLPHWGFGRFTSLEGYDSVICGSDTSLRSRQITYAVSMSSTRPSVFVCCCLFLNVPAAYNKHPRDRFNQTTVKCCLSEIIIAVTVCWHCLNQLCCYNARCLAGYLLEYTFWCQWYGLTWESEIRSSVSRLASETLRPLSWCAWGRCLDGRMYLEWLFLTGITMERAGKRRDGHDQGREKNDTDLQVCAGLWLVFIKVLCIFFLMYNLLFDFTKNNF